MTSRPEHYDVIFHPFPIISQQSDLATERERQLMTERANKKTGLTNGRAANCTPEVEFSPFRALSRRQMTFPFRC